MGATRFASQKKHVSPMHFNLVFQFLIYVFRFLIVRGFCVLSLYVSVYLVISVSDGKIYNGKIWSPRAGINSLIWFSLVLPWCLCIFVYFTAKSGHSVHELINVFGSPWFSRGVSLCVSVCLTENPDTPYTNQFIDLVLPAWLHYKILCISASACGKSGHPVHN